MRRAILLVLSLIFIIPAFPAVAQEVELEIGLVHYTNKSPFVLEGKATPGADIMVRGKKLLTVGESGTFTLELEVKEGNNVFHFKVSKEGKTETKGILVQMDTSTPKVHFYIDKAINSDSAIKTECFDLGEYLASGFTEPDCIIEIDEKKVGQNGISFEVKLDLPKAPSKTDHTIKVTDKYGNVTTSTISVTNIHEKVCKMQIGNKNAMIDDQEHIMPVEVQIVKGSTMVPLRFFCGTFLGCKIEFNAATKAITITDDNNTLIVQVGNPNAKLNGEEFRIQGTPPVIVNGSLVVPFRFIEETFGCKVFYDSPTKTVKIVKYVYP